MNPAASAFLGRQPRRMRLGARCCSVCFLVVGMIAGLLLSASPAAAQEGSVEVDDERYYTKPVQWMIDNNIVTDTTPACFGPDIPATRGETALYMWRMQNQPKAPPHPFNDVTDNTQQPAVSWLYDAEITTGATPTTFAPNEQLTRVQVAALLHRLADEPTASDHPFVDVVAGWQQQPVAWMVANKITTGTSPTTFAPDETLTRGQLATFLYRYQDSPEVTVNPHDSPCDEFSEVDVGAQHSCGLRTDQTIVCWGYNGGGQAEPPNGSFKAVSAGGDHSCAIQTDNTVTCWGTNWYRAMDTLNARYTAVTSGASHSCGLRNDATISCWGYNGHGQTNAPDGQFIAVNAGYNHSCGVRTDNTITCWGDNQHNQLDTPGGQFTDISAGHSHACAVHADSTIQCWGWNNRGQTNAPTGSFTDISAGQYHSCALRTDATIQCWGGNTSGQTSSLTESFTDISAGNNHSCGIRTDATIECWGSNLNGKTDTPDGQFTAISAGNNHSCGIRTDATIQCWGDGRALTNVPSGKFTAISSGHEHTCGVRANSTVNCWGRHPITRSTISGSFSAVSTGRVRTCWLHTNATISCWSGGLTIGAPSGVESSVGPGRADPGTCRPFGGDQSTAGFPLPSGRVGSTGTARVAVVFVDFPNAEASYSTQIEAELGMPYAETYLEASSYQKLDIEFVPLHGWQRAENDHEHYHERSSSGNIGIGSSITAEAVRLADPDFDFNRIDSLMVVLPSSHFSGGIASTTIETGEGGVTRNTWINAFPLEEPREPHRWGHVAAHELIHNLGLLDMYAYADLGTVDDPVDAPAGKTWVTSTFGPMGLRADFPADPEGPRLVQTWLYPDGAQTVSYATRSEAEEMLAWSRWQLGWLDSTQITCVTENEATVTLGPVADPGNSIAMAAIPLSGTEVIVVESRRKIGYDTPRETHRADGLIGTFPALLTEGVLIYTVDAALPSGQLPLVIAGDTGNLQVDRYPILAVGESVTIRGYTITVESGTDTTHTITITRNTD